MASYIRMDCTHPRGVRVSKSVHVYMWVFVCTCTWFGVSVWVYRFSLDGRQPPTACEVAIVHSYPKPLVFDRDDVVALVTVKQLKHFILRQGGCVGGKHMFV